MKLFRFISVSVIAIVIVIAATMITSGSTQTTTTFAQQPCPCPPTGPALPTPVAGMAIQKCPTTCGCQAVVAPTPVINVTKLNNANCCLYIADCACGTTIVKKVKPDGWANNDVGATCVPITKNLKESWKD